LSLNKRVVPREEVVRYFEYPIRHKRCGEDVDRVMHVGEEHRDAADEREEEEGEPYPLHMPEDERHKKRQSRVAGEEESRLEVKVQVDRVEEAGARGDLLR